MATGRWEIEQLTEALVWLDLPEEEKRQARQEIAAFLVDDVDDYEFARKLIESLAMLNPTVRDLRYQGARKFPPTQELLSAVRRNVTLPEWLKALPV